MCMILLLIYICLWSDRTLLRWSPYYSRHSWESTNTTVGAQNLPNPGASPPTLTIRGFGSGSLLDCHGLIRHATVVTTFLHLKHYSLPVQIISYISECRFSFFVWSLCKCIRKYNELHCFLFINQWRKCHKWSYIFVSFCLLYEKFTLYHMAVWNKPYLNE